MHYISTRGSAQRAGFGTVLLGGPAPDGGLYLPDAWPVLGQNEIHAFAGLSYNEVAFRVMHPFIGDAIVKDEFRADVDAAYGAFAHPAVAPLVQIAPDRFLLELFHGPTLSFKDLAMQLLGRMFVQALNKRGERATVIVATSGDTGSAAIHALKGQSNVDVVVLHPKGRVSEVQRRQMTTVLDDNVYNIALEGSFDDAQSVVKALFSDARFIARTRLTAVNSINFARIMAQCVYYFTAAVELGAGRGHPVTFVVPTGNFGDIFAGEAAERMGLPVERLMIATNANDVIAQALNTGVYAAGQAQATLSPSMDIQVASNFERALFEASGRDGTWVARAMGGFAKSNRLDIEPKALKALRARYDARSADDDETLKTIARVHAETGLVIDPHTAVGVAVAEHAVTANKGAVVILATAHPAKFPEAVTRAIGKAPEQPERLADLMAREERYTVLPNVLDRVRDFVLERVRAS